MFGFLATAVAKFASLGAVAQAVTGVSIATATVTGLAATGSLPAPVQDAVSSVVSSVSSIDLPHSKPSASTHAPATDTAGPSSMPIQAAFGKSVSEQAQNGGVAGQSVSEQARATHQPAQAAAHGPTGSAQTTTVATVTSAPAGHGGPAAPGGTRP